ncbi:trypsin-like peptidase domain-containing protein [Bifidobacterium panos]|uniref:Peptidase n=1 Tax=Bifidobacterium panos TaxID=2675321 RepID=A0ABX1T0D6_9BIFI|nr:trypsin-like peptidase domain-containing protein [Bifidobacterium sp. DSM 109963]NMN02608.1 peptidase [Bifidobacterium sp. DSM 109963]
MAEEQNIPNMPDNPQDTQHVESVSSEQDAQHTESIAPVSDAQVPEGDAQRDTTAEAATEVIDTAADTGTETTETTAPAAGTQAAPEQQTAQYRPAPQYGAYGPTPTQPGQAQPGQAQPNQPAQNRNPYIMPGVPNPFRPKQGQADQQFGNAAGQVPPQGAGQPAGQQFQPGQSSQPTQPGQPIQPGTPNVNPNARQDQRASSATVRSVIIAVVAALVSAALCLGIGFMAITSGAVKVPTTSSLSSVSSNQSGSGSATAKSGEAPDWQAVAKQVSESVVSIQAQVSGGVASGSGAILDSDGNIVTNNHVISGATQIQVTLSNGQMYSAKIVGTDTTTDLAVIKLNDPPKDLKGVEFADSDTLAVGENIMAVGNPLGYDDTATTGIVSALNRPVTVMDSDQNNIVTNAVQIDAAINPGNSGGPTFNAAGQVIGINSSIASTSSSSSSSSTSGSIGIGFAIPSNLVKRVANEIMENGSVKHVALGVTIKSSTVEADGVTRAGVSVSSVVSDGPASKAGVKAGDTIVAFNDHAVSSVASLLGFVRASALGDKAKLTIVRDGNTMELDVTLDKQEDEVNGSNRSESNKSQQNDGNSNGNGNNNNNNDNNSGSNGYPFGMW